MHFCFKKIILLPSPVFKFNPLLTKSPISVKLAKLLMYFYDMVDSAALEKF